MKRKYNILLIIGLVITFLLTIGIKCYYYFTSPYDVETANKNTTWLCLGDSITFGETNHEVSYADYAGKMTGVRLIKKGYSGYTTEQLCNELDNIEVVPDIVTVLIGTNDWVYDRELGDPSDQSMDTFCGSMNLLMKKLLRKYPNAEIVFLTPIYRNMHYNPAISFTGTINSNGKTVKDFGDSLKKCAKQNQVEVYDLYAECGIDASNIEKLTNDGTHPNARGHWKIAKKVKELIDF